MLNNSNGCTHSTTWNASLRFFFHSSFHRDIAKKCILEVFAGPPVTGIQSPSVQKTLYDTAKLILERNPKVTQF